MTPEKKRSIPRATKRRSRSKDVRIPPSGFIGADGATHTPDENEFMMAMDRYKRDNHRPFPTWREVLAVMRALGYRKVAELKPIKKV